MTIKKKTLSRRTIINRILFWVTNTLFAIVALGALVSVFHGSDNTAKIAISVIYIFALPLTVAYAKHIYTFECNDWKPLSD